MPKKAAKVEVVYNHSPGPWEVDGDDVRDEAQRVLTNWGGPLADVFQAQRPGECEANARLVSAAPEMMDALIAAKKEMWCMARSAWTMADFKNWAVVQQIDEALDKARGTQFASSYGAEVATEADMDAPPPAPEPR